MNDVVVVVVVSNRFRTHVLDEIVGASAMEELRSKQCSREESCTQLRLCRISFVWLELFCRVENSVNYYFVIRLNRNALGG